MNSKCYSVCEGHSGGNLQPLDTRQEFTCHTAKSGMSIALEDFRRIQLWALKWLRHSSCLGRIGHDYFLGRFFLRLLLGVTLFFVTSFGISGFGLYPSLPSFQACRLSRGVFGSKCSGFGGSCRYILLISCASTVPLNVLPEPVCIALMRQTSPS